MYIIPRKSDKINMRVWGVWEVWEVWEEKLRNAVPKPKT
jgi:hypothetical protein